jgi:hypothetical protein
MGYKRKDDRGKWKIKSAIRLIRYSRQKIAKQIVGENRCNNISYCSLSSRDYPIKSQQNFRKHILFVQSIIFVQNS